MNFIIIIKFNLNIPRFIIYKLILILIILYFIQSNFIENFPNFSIIIYIVNNQIVFINNINFGPVIIKDVISFNNKFNLCFKVIIN